VKIVVAPDSFKGTASARVAARCIADGWRSARPDDTVLCVPLADGGEGTLDAVAAANTAARWITVEAVHGPTGTPIPASYLLLPDGTAVVELARASGLPLLVHPAALTASTRGVGDLIGHALDAGARALVVAVGGSASTDGGAGLFSALGAGVLDTDGALVADGGAALRTARTLDRAAFRPAPPGGVIVLSDVTNPLFGPNGAAYVFGPQKGASVEDVAALDAGLRRWAELCGGDPEAPGAGAAGGTAYGLAALWGARIASGSRYIADLVGLDDALRGADLVVTGEGRFDRTSLDGKGEVRVYNTESGAKIVCEKVSGPAYAVAWGPPVRPSCYWKQGIFGRWKMICP